jgi:hypothetical protein
VLCSVLFPLPLAVQFVAQFLRLAQRPHGAAVPASRFCQLRLADSHGLLADVSADGEYLLPVAVRRVCLCVVADDLSSLRCSEISLSSAARLAASVVLAAASSAGMPAMEPSYSTLASLAYSIRPAS